MSSCKVLVASPYPGLNNVFSRIGKEYPELSLIFYEKNIENLAHELEVSRAEVVITWGEYVREQYVGKVPAVQMKLTFSDILYALETAERFRGKRAFICYKLTGKQAIREYVESVCLVMNEPIRVCDAEDLPGLRQLLEELKTHKYNVVIGGAESAEMAQRAGLNGIQIPYGSESVRNALDSAALLARMLRQMREQQEIYQNLLLESPDYLAVQNQDGSLLYHNGEKNRQEFQELFQRYQQEGQGELNGFELKTKDAIWGVIKKPFMDGGKQTVVHFRKQHFVDSTGGGSITYMNQPESPLIANIYGTTNFGHMREKIELYRNTRDPILISGERGLGKENLAFLLNNNRPLMKIDCNNLTLDSYRLFIEEGLQRIEESASALLLMNADVILPEIQEDLANVLERINKQGRLRLLSTAWDEIYRKVSRGGYNNRLYHLLSGVCLDIPPVSASIQELDEVVYYIITALNIDLGLQIVGISPEAMESIKAFEWGTNLRQLVDVLRRSMMLASSPIVSQDDVQRMIDIEKSLWSSSRGAATFWKGSLEEIEKRIIRGILEEEGMNQTRASKRLGISRSTLWRKIR